MPTTWGSAPPTTNTPASPRPARSWPRPWPTLITITVAVAAATTPTSGVPLAGRLALGVVVATWPAWTRLIYRTVTGFGHGLPTTIRVVLVSLVVVTLAVEAALVTTILASR